MNNLDKRLDSFYGSGGVIHCGAAGVVLSRWTRTGQTVRNINHPILNETIIAMIIRRMLRMTISDKSEFCQVLYRKAQIAMDCRRVHPAIAAELS